MFAKILRTTLFALLFASSAVLAEKPWTLDDNLSYMSMGDSLAAGKGATPVTRGYAYLLYQDQVFGKIDDVTFANAAVPGVTSEQVLMWQVPAAIQVFKPDVITMSVGGNDLERILVEQLDPIVVLGEFAANMGQILCGLRAALPDAVIIVGNQYDIPNLSADIPAVRDVIIAANGLLADVAQTCGTKVADVFSALDGRHGLLLGERKGALDPYEIHPTDAGYRVMAKAFKEAAKQ